MFDDIKSFFVKRGKRGPGGPGGQSENFQYFPQRSINTDTTIITIANQNGGCGKTTTAINLSAALARSDFKVLLIDLDAQSHASLGLGIHVDKLSCSIYDVIMKNFQLESSIFHSYIKNLDIVPATSMLTGAQLPRIC